MYLVCLYARTEVRAGSGVKGQRRHQDPHEKGH